MHKWFHGSAKNTTQSQRIWTSVLADAGLRPRLVHSAGVGLLQLRQRLEFQNARFDGASRSLTIPMPLPRIDNGMSVQEENLAKQNNPH